ncbi:MAG: hypothetical protein OXM56_02135 [Gammaproteobacteria bacterium]|nr:hypothetical protein [Gammaproteobacteria bacterium]
MLAKLRRDARSRTMATHRSRVLGKVGLWSLLVLAGALALVVTLAMQVQGQLQEPAIVDACHGEDADGAGHAVFLIDLQKPLAPAHAKLPGRLLSDVTLDLAAHTELGVYALADYAEAPRMLLGRLCKPYGNGDLAVGTAKDQDATTRDCDDLPAQIPSSVRDSAKRFCAERDALAGRIDALAAQARNASVDNAYLVEALEDTLRDFEQVAGPKSLYVFSDMMQHAEWFSHLDTPWRDWDIEAFSALRESRASLAGASPDQTGGFDATIFYLARQDVTEHPRQRLVHRQFWEAYLAPSETVFEDQAPVLQYAGVPLMDVPTEAELVAQERERVRYERAELARMRADLERSRRDLDAGLERLAEDQQRWRERESELRRDRERLREQETALASERERLATPATSSLAAEEPRGPVNTGGGS